MTDIAFETERTVVRPWRRDEADRMLDTYSRWEVSRWLGAEPKVMEGLDAAHAGIERWSARNEEPGFAGIWAVELKATGVVAGTALLVELNGGDGEYEVGWHFHPDSWGHGYATEIGRGALELGWANGLEEAYAVVIPGNDKSMAVCRRLGMVHQGRSTKYYGVELEVFHLPRPSD